MTSVTLLLGGAAVAPSLPPSTQPGLCMDSADSNTSDMGAAVASRRGRGVGEGGANQFFFFTWGEFAIKDAGQRGKRKNTSG